MIRLERPSGRYLEDFVAAKREFAQEGIVLGPAEATPEALAEYLQWLADLAEGRNLPPLYVPSTEFWILDETGFVGRIMVRHHLNARLERLGGHIGYSVRPSVRGRGHATEALRLALIEARKRGIDRALLTAGEDNIASRRVIERNGGVLMDVVTDDDGRSGLCRYWIAIAHSPG